MKRLATCFLILFVICLNLTALSGCDGGKVETASTDFSLEKDYSGDNPVAALTVADYGVIYIELYPDVAPNTVNNFIFLANSGYYDGCVFHRVVDNFMIQGGDPQGTGTGGPGYTISGEFSANGFANDLSHKRGVISMARMSKNYNGVRAYDSAGSQFFIVQQDSTHLDRQYAAFGEVLAGMDVVDAIAAVPTDKNNKPLKDVVIESITVEAFGKTYDEPIKVS